MREGFRVKHYPSWMDEELSSLKALRRKKKSLWSWAPIRAISKIRQQQFFCVFSIFVQMIDGLPCILDGLRLIVQLERKSKLWQTMPSRVFQHIAEFDETLHIETTIFGRETNMHDHTMKFMPKDYILSVVAIDAAEHFLFNQHRIDLSRLLPTCVDGFWEPDKPMSSTASFKLGGKAEGAMLVATFDFEVLNEEFRQPSLSIDCNASARFRGSSLRRISRAVKSLPSSPNPSPFVRHSNYHFTSPSTSDHNFTDSIYMEKFDLDSSVKETEEWSVHDYSSSDEERFQALRNDPLYLDACAETESAVLSPAIRSQEALGSLDDFSVQLHLANTDCVEKVVFPPSRRTKSDTLCHQIDIRRLLDAQDPEEDGNEACQSKQENDKFFSRKQVEVLERNSPVGEFAADKFCINVETVDSCSIANIFRVGSNDMISNEKKEGQCFIGGIMLSPTLVRPKSLDTNGQALTLEEGEVFSEVNEKHILVEGDQASSPEAFGCPTVYCQDESEIHMEMQAQPNVGVSVQQSCKNVEFESGLVESSQASAVYMDGIALQVLETTEDLELDIFQFSAEDEELSVEAIVVAEDFFGLLERDRERTCTTPRSHMAVIIEESFKQVPFSNECWSSTSTAELYNTNNLYQESQEERLFITPLQPGDLNATTYPSEDRQDVAGGFDCTECAGRISGDNLLDTDDGLGLLSIIEAAESELKKAAQTLRSKERAKLLEDAETKALMKEWGLTDRMFERSQPNVSVGFAPEMPHTPDNISVISLKDGGCLRAMSFQPGSSLVMQVSRPVVIPAKTTSCVDILRSMASQGLENMTIQAFLRMPLEDLVGSVEQYAASGFVARDGRLNGWNSSSPLRQGSFPVHTVKESSPVVNASGSDCTEYKPLKLQALSEEVVSFGDLTHLALKRIEPLAIEGLKVQCDLANEAPNESGKGLGMQNNRINQVPIDGVQVSHSEDGRHISSARSLLDMTVSLDEWLQLCESASEAESEISASKVHLQTLQEEGCSQVDVSPECPTWVSFNENLTVAMLLQLRDPQRYYEPVGASMMALVQAERVNQLCVRSSPLESNIAGCIQHKEGMDQLHERGSGVQLKITGVHVSGVHLPNENTKQSWGNKQQLQSGSRWLVANSKANDSSRYVVSQSSPHVDADSKLGKAEILWSISACLHTPGTTRREPEYFCSLVRNPDLTFTADETGRS